MSARERLIKTLNHEDPGKVVVDLGSSLVTGISARALARLYKALGLEGKTVKVYEPFQALGEVDEEVRKILGIDVVGVASPYTMFGYKNADWKPWKLHDGTDVLVGGNFVTTTDEAGDIYIYPKGDTNAQPSGRMPKGGFYFDNIVRQGCIDEDKLNAREDFSEDFKVFSDEELRFIEEQTDYYYRNTDYGINGGNFLGGLGDFAALPGPGIKQPKGIRSPEEWLIAHYTMPDYVKEVYEFHTEIALKKLKQYKEAVGDKIQVIQISGTDFGTQRSEFISPDMYREFYKPYHKKLNDWVHENTSWKTLYHTCGSVVNLLDDFAEAGIDVLNPMQFSAAGMDPAYLKKKYGDKFVFWGGGVDTQNTLPFGTPEEVKAQVLERLKILSVGGGFVFNTIHNIQWQTPVANILAMFEAIKEFNSMVK